MIRLVRILLGAMIVLLFIVGWLWHQAERDREVKAEALGRIVVLDGERRILLERIAAAPPEQVPILIAQLQRLDFTVVALAADPVLPPTTLRMAPPAPTTTTTPGTTTTTGTTLKPTTTTTTTTEPAKPKPPKVTVPDPPPEPPPPEPPPTTEPEPPPTTTSSPRRVCPPVAPRCI